MRPFGSKSDGKTLQLVQRGTDKRIPVELVKQPSGEVLDPAELEGLHVMVSSESGMGIATIPYSVEDGKLVVEVTADISRQLGLGVYTMTATGRIPDPAYADGYHDYEIVVALCNVTKYGSNETPVKVTANVMEGLRGLNNYQMAVKHGYKGTEEEWLKTLKGENGDDAYEVAKKAGYTGSREEWLKTLIGAPGLSAYELAKADGYEGSLTEWLASLKGEKGDDGDSAYKVAVRNGYVGDEQAWLASLHGADGADAYEVAKAGGYRGSRAEWVASLKGEKGDSAYASYLATTTDSAPMTEKQWANANDFFYQFLFRILKGAGVKPTETDMTADQVYELDRQRREIIEALKSKGVAVDDADGLDGVSRAIKSITLPKIDIFKIWQFNEWQSAELPPLRLSRSYAAADLTKLFAGSRIERLPDIDGVERVKSIRAMCQSCRSLTSATLPNMEELVDSGEAFGACSSILSIEVGAMPKVTTLLAFAYSCEALKSLKIGAISNAVNIKQIAYGCTSLAEVTIGADEVVVSDVSSAFQGCRNLRRVVGVLNYTNIISDGGAFGGCSSIEELLIKAAKCDLWLADCQSLSTDSLKYIVDTLQQSTGKTITLPRSWQQAHTAEAREYAKIAAAKGFSLSFR